MNAPRWAPAESFIFKCNDATKDILEMTVWMYSLTDRTEEQFGFVLLPLVDLRGQGYTKKHLLVKSFENGQLQNTAVVCGIEVMDHEDAMNTKEDRIYEYEAYRPFVGWSHEHLREGSEPRFVLDHEYGDHVLDREERKGKTFEEVDPGIPFNFKVDRDWVTTLIHGGDEEVKNLCTFTCARLTRIHITQPPIRTFHSRRAGITLILTMLQNGSTKIPLGFSIGERP